MTEILLFQDEDILRQWHSGKKARWPRLPDLRFKVQDRVECRIGPHPVKGMWFCVPSLRPSIDQRPKSVFFLYFFLTLVVIIRLGSWKNCQASLFGTQLASQHVRILFFFFGIPCYVLFSVFPKHVVWSFLNNTKHLCSPSSLNCAHILIFILLLIFPKTLKQGGSLPDRVARWQVDLCSPGHRPGYSAAAPGCSGCSFVSGVRTPRGWRRRW